MTSVHDFRGAAEQRYQDLRRRCRACFAATPFDGNRYVMLCEQRRQARLRLERITAMYGQTQPGCPAVRTAPAPKDAASSQ